MKEMTMILKRVPPGYYKGVAETIYTITPNKVYMVQQTDTGDVFTIKYLFRLPAKDKTYEGLITEELFEGILFDNLYEDMKFQNVYEYLIGKDTVRVFAESENDHLCVYAIGPEDGKEWQIEFQKYHK